MIFELIFAKFKALQNQINLNFRQITRALNKLFKNEKIKYF